MRALALRVATIVLSLFFASGCLQARYITQAAVGQERLNQSGIQIDEIIEGQHLDKRTRDLLAHVPRIKAFGERHGLKHTKNYRRYVWVKPPAVVWVVSACDPLRFRPIAWKFPIVGSITYTGWFDRKEADAYAASLASKGWDVDVRASQAYSTLGWFDDPILSTMIAPDEAALGDLADVVLHETLHATFYVPGQSTLNESVASFFGDELALRYMAEVAGPDSPEERAFREVRIRGEKRGKVMKEAYEKLATLYASSLPRAEKLAQKKIITDELRRRLELKRPVTNATLIQYKTYGSGKEEMRQLFEVCGESFPRMLAALQDLIPASKSVPPHTDPGLMLRPLVAKGCPP